MTCNGRFVNVQEQVLTDDSRVSCDDLRDLTISGLMYSNPSPLLSDLVLYNRHLLCFTFNGIHLARVTWILWFHLIAIRDLRDSIKLHPNP